MTPWFIATETFTPEDAAWAAYIEWTGLTQLEEVVSLDGILCPALLREMKPEYWNYNVQEDFRIDFFLDFSYLSGQVSSFAKKNVLCVFRNPIKQPIPPTLASFEFIGYDLVERQGTISALTNCGGYPDVFANAELSRFGLLNNLPRAIDVQQKLRSLHPEDPHANCDVWAIFRAVGL